MRIKEYRLEYHIKYKFDVDTQRVLKYTCFIFDDHSAFYSFICWMWLTIDYFRWFCVIWPWLPLTFVQFIYFLLLHLTFYELVLFSLSFPETKSSNRNERIKEDIDIGGHGNYFVLLIENLDKDLSPLTIKEFIHRQTSISLHAYVFPSLLSEAFTRGALVLNCQKNFEKVCEFLDSPNGFIVSTRGRCMLHTLNSFKTCFMAE